MRCAASLFFLALLAAQPACAADDRFAAAAATLKHYAEDMNTVLPCAYIALSDPTGQRDMAEETYGVTAVRKVVEDFEKNGGSFIEGLALMKVFFDTFKPNWKVDDIRRFTRDCYGSKLIEDLFEFKDKALPLSIRPPFGGPMQ